MFEPGTNQRPVFFHFDFHFRFSILFGHALSRREVSKKKIGHDMICFSFSLEKKMIRDILSWLDICLIKAHDVTHAAPTVSEGRYRGMSGSASYAICRERSTPQRSRGAQAITSTLQPRNLEEEETQHEKAAKILIS